MQPHLFLSMPSQKKTFKEKFALKMDSAASSEDQGRLEYYHSLH